MGQRIIITINDKTDDGIPTMDVEASEGMMRFQVIGAMEVAIAHLKNKILTDTKYSSDGKG